MQDAKWHRLSWVVAVEVAFLAVAATFFLPGGDDLHRFYLPFSRGCLHCGFVPYFGQWVLWPLAFFPDAIAWPLWTAISLAGWLILSRYTGANPAWVLLMFPTFGQVWLGQIDILIAAGLAIAFFVDDPYVQGVGIALALIKPQITAIPLLYLLSCERDLRKVLAAPLLALVMSVVVFGPGWPLDWLTNATDHVPPHAWRLAAVDIWPWGLPLIAVPLFFPRRRVRFELALLASALATPFMGIYSYMIFPLFIRRAWWIVPLSYIWVLAYPLYGNKAIRVLWVLPLALMAFIVYGEVRRKAAVNQDEPPCRASRLLAALAEKARRADEWTRASHE